MASSPATDRAHPPDGRPGARRAAVLGRPIRHSRSPDLHLAAYRALGLSDWRYDRIECGDGELPTLVGALGPEFVGLSVTMPGKLAALAFADQATERARLVGSANTLVRTPDGWRADCTDIDGMSGALSELGVEAPPGSSAVVVGAGGTALPTIFALADRGFGELTIVVRDESRAAAAIELCTHLGVAAATLPFDQTPTLGARCRDAGVVVSTVPASAAATLAVELALAPKVVDVIYDPWPTPLAEAVEAASGQVVGGLVMLLQQAFRQVEQFTGLPAPREAMAAALGAAGRGA